SELILASEAQYLQRLYSFRGSTLQRLHYFRTSERQMLQHLP
ncbi:hypothetical protein A2U01_0104864, partial [Trifolium medium]|nr:hypothetical protein [Trifolium medium]